MLCTTYDSTFLLNGRPGNKTLLLDTALTASQVVTCGLICVFYQGLLAIPCIVLDLFGEDLSVSPVLALPRVRR